jgi:hypothetical protein
VTRAVWHFLSAMQTAAQLSLDRNRTRADNYVPTRAEENLVKFCPAAHLIKLGVCEAANVRRMYRFCGVHFESPIASKRVIPPLMSETFGAKVALSL